MGMTNRAAAPADPCTMFTVRFTTVNRRDQVVTKEKSFRTAAAMERWSNREDNGVVEFLAFARPE
jgi:hypothetical protein